MDQAAYKQSFPAFPMDEESINQLKALLAKDGYFTEAELNTMRKQSQATLDFVEKVALNQKITPEILAKAEAEICKCPYIKLDETQIENNIFKLVDIKLIKSRKVVPIKLNVLN